MPEPRDYAELHDSIKAEFHALYFHLGPFGRQDIHLHPRIDRDTLDVLVGFGRECVREPGRLHVQKRLTAGAAWSKRGTEGQPLDGPVGKDPPLPEVVHFAREVPSDG